METPIENISAQNKTPATQPTMTAKNLEAFRKSKEERSFVPAEVRAESAPVQETEEYHQVDLAI